MQSDRRQPEAQPVPPLLAAQRIIPAQPDQSTRQGVHQDRAETQRCRAPPVVQCTHVVKDVLQHAEAGARRHAVEEAVAGAAQPPPQDHHGQRFGRLFDQRHDQAHPGDQQQQDQRIIELLLQRGITRAIAQHAGILQGAQPLIKLPALPGRAQEERDHGDQGDHGPDLQDHGDQRPAGQPPAQRADQPSPAWRPQHRLAQRLSVRVAAAIAPGQSARSQGGEPHRRGPPGPLDQAQGHHRREDDGQELQQREQIALGQV